jgi:hypothetical protein
MEKDAVEASLRITEEKGLALEGIRKEAAAIARALEMLDSLPLEDTSREGLNNVLVRAVACRRALSDVVTPQALYAKQWSS